MVEKLWVYNAAFGHLGSSRLVTLTENRPDRRELDAVWDSAVRTVLESGLWRFAIRTVQLEPDEDVEPGFGLQYVYSEPEDFVRKRLISPDEHQTQEDLTFRQEAGYIRSAYSPLYFSYISDDDAYGFNLGAWPQVFANAVGVELAYQSSLPVTKDKSTKNDLLIIKKRFLIDARRLNAIEEPVKGKPLSSWATSRLNNSRSRDQRRAGSN